MQNDMGVHELHLEFTPGFRAMNLAQQSDAFQNYISNMINEIARINKTIPIARACGPFSRLQSS
jgi:hypothetical protein